MAGISSSFSRDLVNWTPKQYAYITMSGDQSGYATNDPVEFDTMLDGNMSFDSANYRATLKPNKTYRLSSSIWTSFTGITGQALFGLYNVTNSEWIGNASNQITTSSAGHNGNSSICTATITPTVDTIVEVRVRLATAVTTMYSVYAYWEIQEIDTFAPSRAKWQYEYVSQELDLTLTLANWTTYMAKGIFYKTNNGVWRLNFNVEGVMTSAARTGISVVVSGVSFKSVPTANYQNTSGDTAAAVIAVFTYVSGVTMVWFYANTTTTTHAMSGDIELNAKPTTYAIPSDV